MLRQPAAEDAEYQRGSPISLHYGSSYSRGRPVISAAAPDPVVDLLNSENWQGKLGQLAQAVVQQQVETHAEAKTDATLRGYSVDSLVEQSVLKVLESLSGGDAAEVIELINDVPHPLALRTIWDWKMLPYHAVYAARRGLQKSRSDPSHGVPRALTIDLDEWILQNERSLRDDQGARWTMGLVRWSTHCDIVFPDSKLTPSSRIITRSLVSGYTFLDDMRPDSIQVQPSVNAFKEAFYTITGGVLEGLDWSNVIVAGGIVLGGLSCVDLSQAERYKSSDIDIYIYGLGPREANAKIDEIFQVWKSNLPKDAEDQVLVVRNSRTITFFSKYPIKRVQIVLKLVSSPREVLLNFDLDVCSMAWDGSELWLLPRAARALESR